MKGLVAFIMRGRAQAVLAAVFTMALSMLFLPFVYVCGAVIALVALRRGWQDGVLVTVIATVMGMVMAMTMGKHPLAGIPFALQVWFMVLPLALVLRHTVSLARAVHVACGLGIIGIGLIHLILPQPEAWWRQWYQVFFDALSAQNSFSAEQQAVLDQTVNFLAQYGTAIAGAAIAVSPLLSLLIARWWQAMLYNPGGFRQEFHGLRLGKVFAVTTVATVLAAMLPLGQVSDWGRDLALLMLFLASFQGIALVHAWAAARKAHRGLLVGFYILIFFTQFQAIILLAGAAIVDTWLDIRRRMDRGSGAGPAAPSNN